MEVLKMEHIMQSISFWEPLYLMGLQTSANDHYDYLLKNREKEYDAMDMYYFLSPEQVRLIDRDFFNILFGRSDFFQVFTNLVEVLKNTVIGNDILAIVPCDIPCFICVTKDNVYGVYFQKDVPASFEPRISLTVYCDNYVSNTEHTFAYEGQWKYQVDKFLYNDFEICLTEVKKETSIGPIHIFGPKIDGNVTVGYFNKTIGERTTIFVNAVYDDENANYKIFANDVKFAELEYTFKDFSKNFASFEYIEDLCLIKRFKDADELYSIFCDGLAHFDVTKNEIKFVSAALYNTNYCTFDEDFDEDECYNYINSAVTYEYGKLKAIQFNDDNGGHWCIQKDYWSFCNDSIEVTSYDGEIEYYISKIIEDSDDDNTLKRNISCSYTKKMIDNFIFNIVKTAKTVHIPKYFPKE